MNHLPMRFGAMFLALSLWHPVNAQDAISANRNDYVKSQTFVREAFFKDNNIWVYTQAFAEQFGMPKEGISGEIKGLAAAAFRIEDSTNVKLCGMGGKEDNCMPGGECMLDLYIDETKHPLPWRQPDQRADWVNRYSSLIWIKGTEDAGGFGTAKDRGARLKPFVDHSTKQVLQFYAKTDREFDKRSEMYGWAQYSFSIYGYRRAIVNQLTLLSLSRACSKAGDNAPSAHYLYLGASEGGQPVDKTFYQAVLPTAFTERIDAMLKNLSSRKTEFYKSILLPVTPSNQSRGETK